uniref:40S ribosomal protein SA n=1 Tax=Myotis lucifugus TaxID=59463 RepID=G1Q7T0_MYOLU
FSGANNILQNIEEDVLKFLAAGTHLGGTNLDFQMEQPIYKRESDGTYIINPRRTWEELLLAAHAIVAIGNPANVSHIVQEYRPGSCAEVCCCFAPGTFTNQIQAAFREPRLPVFTDPRADYQLLTEASYVNLPTIALCNTESSAQCGQCQPLQQQGDSLS